ncbi:MAG: hypothetical protein ACKOZW_08320 [Cyanobium sp.]
MDDPIWLTTDALCRRLAISRSTLFEIRRQGLLKDGRHVVRKNPAAPHSDLLWHQGRCSALLALARARSGTLPPSGCPRAMAEFHQPLSGQQGPADYVLLHRDTGTARYATRATEAEIHRANQRLQGAGSASRYVAARHLGHHGFEQQG